MVCPKCAANTRVARSEKKGGIVVRYRFCPHCGYTIGTKEVPLLHLFTQEDKEDYEEYINSDAAQSEEK